MTEALRTTDSLFFSNGAHLDIAMAGRSVRDLLNHFDDGELFLEYRESESIVLDDGVIRAAGFDVSRGFGLRGVTGAEVGFAHSDEISLRALRDACGAVRTTQPNGGSAREGGGVKVATSSQPTQSLYQGDRPFHEAAFPARVAVLRAIDAHARGSDPAIKQVSAHLSAEWQAVQIMRGQDDRVADLRPLVRMNVTIIMERDGKRESGSVGVGGRYALDRLLDEPVWKDAVDEAIRRARVALESVAAPSGEMDVILGPGWPGILLHEAVGHGLEADFNRKETSSFSGRIGQKVAADGVTVIDDGTLPDRRGSITIDDEGTPGQRTVLIEDGVLLGYMNDRLNARLMGAALTGNGRRQSYAHQPIPRMTNTVMAGGYASLADMLSGTRRGLYAVDFGGGQVDITSGEFVFSMSEAYLVENGEITRPVKGATLIGNGADAMRRISMVGHDVALDPGIGTCGKAGQGVPVGVGQPSLKLSGLTVGGTG
ncbi:metalloprotease TldD [Candidatus Kirkpatrickella diaphorinae]|uniref:Metalloprotease TldD n=1 Tax=Candidatus Kirkpatrickella diaphorinae TaxID=2984322 RepID=A0ABY6GII9_9PROT|nr:metalloprotease TldD [Candidatus Kirkpatrickella diaphorinae]UYH51074.1 metalloprotease TldD [Candidatus Kirkpatrickella diaphorinae]